MDSIIQSTQIQQRKPSVQIAPSVVLISVINYQQKIEIDVVAGLDCQVVISFNGYYYR